MQGLTNTIPLGFSANFSGMMFLSFSSSLSVIGVSTFKKEKASIRYPILLKRGITVYSLMYPSFSSLVLSLVVVGCEVPIALAKALSLLQEFFMGSEAGFRSISFTVYL